MVEAARSAAEDHISLRQLIFGSWVCFVNACLHVDEFRDDLEVHGNVVPVAVRVLVCKRGLPDRWE